MTPAERAERAAYLWSRDGVPYSLIAEEIHELNPGRIARRLGFWRGKSRNAGHYIEGPCIDCLVPYPVDRLDRDRRCGACQALADPSEAVQEAMEAWGIDLEFERREHRGRMEDAARKKRLRRPYTMIPSATGGEKPERENRRMWG